MADISLAVRLLMALSGLTGLTAFILANFILKGHKELKTIVGLIQIGANSFVFVSWLGGFLQAAPCTFWRYFALIGFLFPLGTASVTFVRVILPAIKCRRRK